MKNLFRITSVILSLCLVSAFIGSFFTIDKKAKTNAKQQEELKMTINQEEIQPLLDTYNEADDEALAILINNRDFSKQVIEMILQQNGYKNYDEACEKLAEKNYLVYVPSFEIAGMRQGGIYTRSNSVLALNAKERGII